MNKNIFQIFLSDFATPLPPILQTNINFLKALYPNFSYYLFTSSTLRDWLGDNYGFEILNAYDSLIPYAFKADLARYCLLYQLGGWYSDITVKHQAAIVLGSNLEFCYFYDHGAGSTSPYRSSHDVMNAFFYSQKGHKILSITIENILRNVRDRFYGITPLCVTGPTLFGRAVAQYAPHSSLLMGHFLPLTPSHLRLNKAFIAQDGTIVAWHKSAWHDPSSSGEDLSSFGLQGTNDYHALWRSRSIYNPNI